MTPELRDKGFLFIRQTLLALIRQHHAHSHRAKQSCQSTQLLRMHVMGPLPGQTDSELFGTPDLSTMMAFSHSNYGNMSITSSWDLLLLALTGNPRSTANSSLQHPFSWRPELPLNNPPPFPVGSLLHCSMSPSPQATVSPHFMACWSLRNTSNAMDSTSIPRRKLKKATETLNLHRPRFCAPHTRYLQA